MGNVEPKIGSTVHGVVHLLTPEQFQRLSKYENNYSVQHLIIDSYDGRKINATVYISNPKSLLLRENNNLPPPLRYANLIRQGAKEWRLESNYVKWLFALRTVNEPDRRRDRRYWMIRGWESPNLSLKERNRKVIEKKKKNESSWAQAMKNKKHHKGIRKKWDVANQNNQCMNINNKNNNNNFFNDGQNRWHSRTNQSW